MNYFFLQASMNKTSNTTMLNTDLRATCSQDHLAISAESQHTWGSTQGFNLSTVSEVTSTARKLPFHAQDRRKSFTFTRTGKQTCHGV
jgi:hypothetical protein